MILKVYEKRRDRKERRYLQEQMSFLYLKTGRDIWGRKSQKRPGSTEIYQNNPGLGILFSHEAYIRIGKSGKDSVRPFSIS